MELTFRAWHKHARIAPRKARYVIDMIRNKPVNEALEILKFSNRRAARFIERVLKSAIANADEESMRRKIELDPNKLLVAEAIIEESTRFKRYKPRSRGMANPILKRNSHIKIAVAPAEEHDAELRELEEERQQGEQSKAKKPKKGKKAAAAATQEKEEAAKPTEETDEGATTDEATSTDEGATTDTQNDDESKKDA